METIPSVFWMIIISVLAIMVCLVLFYLAMLLKESRDGMVQAKELMKNADRTLKQVDLIVNDIRTSMNSVRGTIEEVNQSILVPIRKISQGVSFVTNLFGFGTKNTKDTE